VRAYGDAVHWIPWPLRVTSSLSALLLFDQAVFAGQFLSGAFSALQTHRDNATYSGLAMLATAVGAALLRWPGRGPIWPLFACLGLFALIGAQIAIGFARLLVLHIPLGVLTIVGAVALSAWSWRFKAHEGQ